MKSSHLAQYVLIAIFVCASHLGTRAQNKTPVPTPVPTTAAQVWADYDPRAEPLDVKTVREWIEGDLTLRYVTYHVGTFKSKASRIAAYFAFPTAGKNLPALLQIHGGGQRASLREVRRFAKRGYACLSVNWGGRPMEDAKPGEPNTDWGNVDPTQNNVQGYFSVLPKANTLDAVQSPRNNNWYLLTIACRRGLTFLEKQGNIDANHLGVFGHSMGGRITGLVTGSDARVKASSPSVGGSGHVHEDLWGLPNSARHFRGNLDLYKATLAGETYLARVKCPILFLSSTNDFNAPMNFVERGMATVPHENKRSVYAPHLNHRFTPETEITRPLWFDAHLQNRLTFPKSPQIKLHLANNRGVPVAHVSPDTSRPIDHIDIYYSYGRDPRNRFWTDGQAKLHLQSSNGEDKSSTRWTADCPVFDLDEPLFVFANVYYKLTEKERREGDPATFALSVATVAYPNQLKAAGVKATERKQTVIDDFKRGYHDWYQLNANNPHWWQFVTRKLADPRWEAPKNGELRLTIKTDKPGNTLGVAIHTHAWRHYTGYKAQTYLALVPLKKTGEQTIALTPGDFRNPAGEQLGDWFGITELKFRAGDKAALDFQKSKTNSPPSGANRLEQWQGSTPTLRDLRWLGGEPTQRRKAYLPKR